MNIDDAMGKAGLTRQALENWKVLNEIAAAVSTLNDDEMRAVIALTKMIKAGKVKVVQE